MLHARFREAGGKSGGDNLRDARPRSRQRRRLTTVDFVLQHGSPAREPIVRGPLFEREVKGDDTAAADFPRPRGGRWITEFTKELWNLSSRSVFTGRPV